MCKCEKKRKMQTPVVCEPMSALKKKKVLKRGGACGWGVRLNFNKGQLEVCLRAWLESRQPLSRTKVRRRKWFDVQGPGNGVCKGERGR